MCFTVTYFFDALFYFFFWPDIQCHWVCEMDYRISRGYTIGERWLFYSQRKFLRFVGSFLCNKVLQSCLQFRVNFSLYYPKITLPPTKHFMLTYFHFCSTLLVLMILFILSLSLVLGIIVYDLVHSWCLFFLLHYLGGFLH